MRTPGSNLNLYKRALVASLAFLAIGLSGCAKESEGGGSTAAPVPAVGSGTVGTAVIPGSPTAHPFDSMTTGATIDFTFDSVATLNTYVQMHPVNDPRNMKMNVQLSELKDTNGNKLGRWAGRILLGYYDTGNYYIANFESGFGVNQVSYKNQTTGKPEAEFNRWFNGNLGGVSTLVFHGFFQDRYGAIVFVVDGGVDQGDGSGYTSVNGSVYFKNFQVGYAAQSPEKCWFIVIGPYDCRTFLTGSGPRDEQRINTTSAIYPSTSDGYQRLGTFKALDKIKAFGN